EATVEGWFKSEDFNNHYFYSYGAQDNRMYIKNSSGNPTITAAMDSRVSSGVQLNQSAILTSNEWCHVAWVTGRGGMRLYVNGVLAANNSSTASFLPLPTRRRPIAWGGASARAHAAFIWMNGAFGPRSAAWSRFA